MGSLIVAEQAPYSCLVLCMEGAFLQVAGILVSSQALCQNHGCLLTCKPAMLSGPLVKLPLSHTQQICEAALICHLAHSPVPAFCLADSSHNQLALQADMIWH